MDIAKNIWTTARFTKWEFVLFWTTTYHRKNSQDKILDRVERPPIGKQAKIFFWISWNVRSSRFWFKLLPLHKIFYCLFKNNNEQHEFHFSKIFKLVLETEQMSLFPHCWTEQTVLKMLVQMVHEEVHYYNQNRCKHSTTTILDLLRPPYSPDSRPTDKVRMLVCRVDFDFFLFEWT